MGESDSDYHTGKWNFYAHDASEESALILVNHYVRELARAMVWQPTALDREKVARWQANYERRWGKSA